MITLRTPDGIVATLDPDNGGTVSAISLPDGRHVLWSVGDDVKSRLEAHPLPTCPAGVESQRSWALASRGGWEVLAPNAGDERHVDGETYPFHGTAGRMPWRVIRQTPTFAKIRYEDEALGFCSERSIGVRRTQIRITEKITNSSESALRVAWGSHLAFGNDMLRGQPEIAAEADVIAGHIAGATAGAIELADGVTPAAESASLAYARTRGMTGRASIFTPEQNIRARLTWDATAFPYLWTWIELGGTTGWPWFGAVRAIGLEPMSSWPSAPAKATEGADEFVTIASHDSRSGFVHVNFSWGQTRATKEEPK